MKAALRLIFWSICALTVLLVVLGTVESYTADRRFRAFLKRTAVQNEMTEAEVTSVAGPPDAVFTDFGNPDDPRAPAAGCRKSNASRAITYVFEYHRWFGNFLHTSSGTDTVVVCLNANNRVVHHYLRMIQF
jgi:hypothetical protein